MSVLTMLGDLESEYTIHSDDSIPFTLRLEVIKEFRTELKEFFKLLLEVKNHLQFIEDHCDISYLGSSNYISKYVGDFTEVVGSTKGRELLDGCELIQWADGMFIWSDDKSFEEAFEEAFPIKAIEIVEKELSANYLVDKILADKELALYLLSETENFNK
jgi:hypothetical protein